MKNLGRGYRAARMIVLPLIAADSTGVPVWLYMLTTFGGLAISALMLGIATYPIWKDRRQADDAVEKRNERLDATADAVLGRKADPDRGRDEVRGLASIMTVQAQHVEEMRDLMNHMIEAQRQSLQQHEHDSLALKRLMDEHLEADNTRFTRLEKMIVSVRRAAARRDRGAGT